MDDFISWINEELNYRGWSQNELARRMGITASAVSKTMLGKSSVTRDFCAALATAFGMDEDDVLIKAGKRTTKPGLSEIQKIYNELPAEERKGILDFAKWKLQQIRREKSTH